MYTRPLPPTPSLENLRKQAKSLKDGHNKAIPDDIERIRNHLPHALGLSDSEITHMGFALHDAQFVIAREYGFKSWPKLKRHVCPPEKLQMLKEAIDTSDTDTILKLIKEDKALLNKLFPNQYRYTRDDITPLTYACLRGEVDTVRTLLELGADSSKDGYSGLLMVHSKTIEIWEILLRYGVDFNVVLDERVPLLACIAIATMPNELRWLLEHGADPNLVAKQPFRPLDAMLFSSPNPESPHKKECIDILTASGAKSVLEGHPVYELLTGQTEAFQKSIRKDPTLVNSTLPSMAACETDDQAINYFCGWSMLHLAAFLVDEQATRISLSAGADINARAKYPDARIGITPIVLLLFGMRRVPFDHKERVEMLRLFMEHNADTSLTVDIASLSVLFGPFAGLKGVEMNPLDFAISLNEDYLHTAIELLLENGAKPSNLYGAARLGLVEEVRRHLADGADPNEKGISVMDGRKISVVSAAAKNGHEDICQMLLDAGANDSISALDAARGGLVNILERILVENPSQIDLRGEMSLMPLHEASIHNHTKTIKVLLRHGGDINCLDMFENTTLHKAVEFSSTEAAELLLKRGADIHAKNNHGATPIIHAAWAGASVKTIQLLIDHGANVNDSNKYGKVLDVSKRWGHKAITDYLLRHMSDVS